jgi:fructosamine-3-kinase
VTRDKSIAQLCAGMHRVQMPMQHSADVANALAALNCLNPLQPIWKDVKKKSRIQHALCDMLDAILTPLANEGAFKPICLRLQPYHDACLRR